MVEPCLGVFLLNFFYFRQTKEFKFLSNFDFHAAIRNLIMKKLYIFYALILYSLPVFAGKQGTAVVGVKLTTPQIVSFSVSYYPYHAWLVQVEPGLGGGKLNIGLGGNYEYTIGAALKMSILQTWLIPMGGVDKNQTYVGGEFEWMFKGVNFNIGLFGHTAGTNPQRDMIFSAGLGIGF